ncbi:hypothetical protein PHYBLDRAFT_159640 [Phycomyces blakesleeanus NRRL 1555(-)]|uniref:Uncharacterized protein n=2 Tax=Phycomyces blakesleeanus TaxID=4837 RepID=A0A167LEU5_PHYB8|nr:hypothetical protein PHYBLDRAFT_159640 [Phycomyces blakesleeanus NRRL 1555(-)]OAD70297.1 hypothetical protein PHYBLDRAFT_159640 [Phycomyces blakesleeanus NRRL 1555(-)]|eukprot:XP_018288337.1 hypothetical protein PHYBLDRAFT_159640 [Phycomyces blakesleeanus NRRL 1555(-)]
MNHHADYAGNAVSPPLGQQQQQQQAYYYPQDGGYVHQEDYGRQDGYGHQDGYARQDGYAHQDGGYYDDSNYYYDGSNVAGGNAGYDMHGQQMPMQNMPVQTSLPTGQQAGIIPPVQPYTGDYYKPDTVDGKPHQV